MRLAKDTTPEMTTPSEDYYSAFLRKPQTALRQFAKRITIERIRRQRAGFYAAPSAISMTQLGQPSVRDTTSALFRRAFAEGRDKRIIFFGRSGATPFAGLTLKFRMAPGFAKAMDISGCIIVMSAK
jgi:hypothetical protein